MQTVEFLLAALSAALNARIARRSPWLGFGLTVWTTLSLSSVAADAIRLFEWLPAVAWIRAAGLIWFLMSVPFMVASRLWNRSASVDPGRRAFLRAGAGLALAPAVGISFAVKESRRDAKVREVAVQLQNLPPDLDGLRLVQISDIHLSPFFSRDQLRRVVDQANGLRADIAIVTGDLITSFGDPLQEAINELSRLRSTAGTYGCLGNHEVLAGLEDEAAREGRRCGLRFLRSESERLRFGRAELTLAGVDYQRKSQPYLAGIGALLCENGLNLLLSHNPDVFPVAASQGWDLTLAGHTHGGQITLEYLHPSLNPARFYTPYIDGLYRFGNRAGFVTSGLGTVGVPARFGTSPEIALIRLTRCA